LIFPWSLAMLLLVPIPPTQAQQTCVQPVFSQNPIDGTLIGFEADCRFGNWEPFGRAAYGLKSKLFRYEVGLGLISSAVPVIGGEGGLRASLLDWPSSPILGQLGERGIALSLSHEGNQARAFWGYLWSETGPEPQVAYVAVDMDRSYSLPFGLYISSSSNMTYGALLGGSDSTHSTFNSNTETLTFSIGDLRMTGRWGRLSNKADLKDFEFVTAVRGITKVLRGHDFWSFDLERRFTLYQTSIPLPLELPTIGHALPIQLSGALTFQAGSATHERPPLTPVAQMESPQGPEGPKGAKRQETETLFSWGLAAIVSVSQFQLRADLVFTQDGQFQFLMNF
jgi:hypothetical protein